MLIKKEPVGHVRITKEGSIEIEHYSDGKKKSCIYCGTLTKKRILGSPECSECIEYGYEKCKQCKFGFRKSEFHCNGNDLEDHFTYYTACAIRDGMGNMRKEPNYDYGYGTWHLSPMKRKICFKEKKSSEMRIKKRNSKILKQQFSDWIYRHIPRHFFKKYLNKKFKKLRLQFEKNYKNMN